MKILCTVYLLVKGTLNTKPITIPVFKIVQKVIRQHDDTLSCNYCLSKRFLFICRHILVINNGVYNKEDVCVRNYIEYAQKYGDARYKNKTAEFDKCMKNYNGPKYHVLEDEVLPPFPIYQCKSVDNHNLSYF